LLIRLIVWKICNAQSIVSIKRVIIPLLLTLLIVSALTLIAQLISTVSGARYAARRRGGRMQEQAASRRPGIISKWRL
jgi:hypothetical protein